MAPMGFNKHRACFYDVSNCSPVNRNNRNVVISLLFIPHTVILPISCALYMYKSGNRNTFILILPKSKLKYPCNELTLNSFSFLSNYVGDKFKVRNMHA